MKNTFGQNVALTIFGESHGRGIGCVLDGLAPGIPVDTDTIRHYLDLRRPSDALSTSRREPDPVEILSGVCDGKTTGTPLCLFIPNSDTHSEDYGAMLEKPRPGHADYTARMKYHGFEDPRGGGHFSGRITAVLVAAAGILLPALERKGIRVGTHIASVGDVSDRSFGDLGADLTFLREAAFAALDAEAGERMKTAILAAREAGDSIGGVLETVVTGMPAGVGEPWFDTVEGVLSKALFSVPAVKGVEFGDGFALCRMNGSQANDPFAIRDGKVVTLTNHNGGINGGITNGSPILFRCAVKPTPTIYLEQRTVNLSRMEDTTLQGKGRHDPCIVQRARAVIDSVTALALCDLLSTRYGTDWLAQ